MRPDAYPNLASRVFLPVAQSTVTLPFEGFDGADGPFLGRLTARHGIGQSLAGRTDPMGQRGERAVFPDAPAVGAATGEVGAETRPIDAIMDRYARGEDAALDELYRLCAGRVRGFLARMCASASLADDLTQDAFLRIHTARGTFVAGAPALPWMFAIARNSYLDHRRREEVRRAHRSTTALLARERTLDSPAGGDRAAIARQMLGVVQQALMGLPVRQREAFILIRFEGLSLAEAALVLGATQAAVKILVHRAYVAVREALDKQDPDRRRGGGSTPSP
jgi:RNA polymerase sigma-70 factor (ECF subfamily)